MKDYLNNLNLIKKYIKDADAVLIGAGAGLSTSAGHSYSGERFFLHFSDFNKKYGINDIYSGGFYPFKTKEEYFAWWSRHIYVNRYLEQESKTYKNLLEIIKDKDYFVLTTNVDHMFLDNGFLKEKLFYTQGDYGLFQCKNACHNKTYDNKEIVLKMYKEQKDMKIPSDLIPYCPVCKGDMEPNLRKDAFFVQDDGWYKANSRYADFINKNKNKKLVIIELGVGMNTPSIIKYPFWKFTYNNKNAIFIAINKDNGYIPKEISDKSIVINEDISKVLIDIKSV